MIEKAIQKACINDRPKTLQRLIEQWTKLSNSSKGSNFLCGALCEAAKKGNDQCVQTMLEHLSIDLDYRHNGKTALQLAYEYGKSQSAKSLYGMLTFTRESIRNNAFILDRTKIKEFELQELEKDLLGDKVPFFKREQ